MSVHQLWQLWRKRNPVFGHHYAILYARLVNSPRARREWRG
jgi:hypothetical protein